MLLTTILAGAFFWLVAIPTNLVVFTGASIASTSGFGEAKVEFAQTLFWIGWGTAGLLILPKLDGCARHKPMYILLLFGLIAAITQALMTSPTLYAIASFVMGLTFPAAGVLCYFIIQEKMHSSSRPLVVMYCFFAYSGVLLLMACLGYAADRVHMSWRVQTLLWYLPYVLALVLGPLFIQETREALSPALPTDYASITGAKREAPSEVQELPSSSTKLFSEQFRVTTIATMVCWSACSAGYYGLSYCSASLSPNLYMDMALYALLDILGYGVATPLMKQFGTLQIQLWSFSGAAVALLIGVLLPQQSFALMCVALCGRFFIDVAFCTIYVLLVDCFPAEVRSAAAGFANAAARFTTAGAPLLSLASSSTAVLVFGCLSALAAGATRAISKANVKF